MDGPVEENIPPVNENFEEENVEMGTEIPMAKPQVSQQYQMNIEMFEAM